MKNNIKALIHKYTYGLSLVNKVLTGHKFRFYLLLIIAIMSSLLEYIGYSMIIPLVEAIMGDVYKSYFSFFMEPLLEHVSKNTAIFLIVAAFAGLMVFKSLLNLVRIKMGFSLAFDIRDSMRSSLFEKYVFSRFDYLIKNKQGEIYHNTIVEPQQSSHVLLQLINFFVSLTALLICYCILLINSYQMTIALTAIVVPIFALMLFLGNKRVNKLVKKRIENQQTLSSVCSESLNSIKQVKIYNIEKKQISRFKHFSQKTAVLNKNVQFTNTIPTVIAQPIVIVTLLLIAAYIIFVSKINISEIVPVMTLFLMVSQPLLNNVGALAQNRLALESLAPSLSLIVKLLFGEIKQEDETGNKEFDELKEDIVFDNVKFAYDSSKYIFNNLKMTVPLGKMTALIGPSGIGKSTIADLLSGLYFPEKGRILINGTNIKDYDVYSWRKKIGYVSQDTILFNDTISENVWISNPQATEQDVYKALEMAHCMDFIKKLPDGINTMVGDKGVMISGGQRQRIAIARAILRDPEIFIFDEATSALDNESEKLIQKSIEELSKIKTIVVIAHRLTTIENADVVYDLGKIEL